ncbi:MAG: 30S ribosomal protein S17 [Actinobacteria bacterium ADurb.BinA094]|jgi:small subunit ribosomal protein S17|nr:MAG: 30S ribosomal protein S17 [Actinobacteria bacterium ADurb.BinA094]
MATTKKTDSGKPAPKHSAARKPAAKKTAARKTAAKKPTTARKAAAPEAKAVKKTSAARSKAKAERTAPAKVPGRKERRGVVVSDAMDKTIVVRIDVAQKHERYGKVVRRSSKLHAHDERNTAGVGDLVRVVETRPLSATKRWRLLEVLEKAK